MSNEHGRRFSLPAEAAVSAVIALVISVGAFYSLQTSVDYDERAIERLELRVSSIEDRERASGIVLTRVDTQIARVHEDLTVLKEQMGQILERLPRTEVKGN